MTSIPPHFAGRPVVLAHVESGRDRQGRPLAACSGIPFEPMPVQRNPLVLAPTVPCMGCWMASRLVQNRATDGELAEAVGVLNATMCRRCGWPILGAVAPDPDGDGIRHADCASLR